MKNHHFREMQNESWERMNPDKKLLVSYSLDEKTLNETISALHIIVVRVFLDNWLLVRAAVIADRVCTVGYRKEYKLYKYEDHRWNPVHQKG